MKSRPNAVSQEVPHLRLTPAVLETTVYSKYDYHDQGQ